MPRLETGLGSGLGTGTGSGLGSGLGTGFGFGFGFGFGLGPVCPKRIRASPANEPSAYFCAASALALPPRTSWACSKCAVAAPVRTP